eukprot:TRINITY_DN34015_c0_g1_i1.p1 TRINITY_DN34015_c0_g1~~TRINITY_DN34015_c0_g1_i1.p1  ORF type:complete len:135 (+),score=35.98 TRINITY_DN34015_c0_g1_i1:1-405(+)
MISEVLDIDMMYMFSCQVYCMCLLQIMSSYFVCFFFFFLNDPATTEIYTLHIVGSVRCVQETASDDLQSKDILKVILVLIDIYDIAQENIYNQLFSSTAVFISDGLEGQNLNELKDKIIEKIGKIITNFIIQVD